MNAFARTARIINTVLSAVFWFFVLLVLLDTVFKTMAVQSMMGLLFFSLPALVAVQTVSATFAFFPRDERLIRWNKITCLINGGAILIFWICLFLR